ncbi:MAG: hypothetical protein K2Q12_07760 [Rickettsiales bacterium]|nr:hypothetical protein [Rickettsiales bacterium]
MDPQTHVLMTLLLNGVVTALLAATILYCVKLNTRIRILQDSKSELAALIKQFDESTQLATHSISEIHKASKKINENMQARLDKANYLADDLAFMIEKANKLAERMDGQISVTRGVVEKPSGAAGLSPRAARTAPVDATQETLAAKASMDAAAAQNASEKERPARGIEALRARAAEIKNAAMADESPSRDTAGGGRRVGARMRSKAEQELFDALKAKG